MKINLKMSFNAEYQSVNYSIWKKNSISYGAQWRKDIILQDIFQNITKHYYKTFYITRIRIDLYSHKHYTIKQETLETLHNFESYRPCIEIEHLALWYSALKKDILKLIFNCLTWKRGRTFYITLISAIRSIQSYFFRIFKNL